MIDTHCHLYSEEFDTDRKEMIARAQAVGVEQFFLPAIDSTAHDGMFSLETEFPNVCFAMMGLHPVYVKDNYKQELQLVESWLGKRSFCAIGEIGLDFYWSRDHEAQQYEAFQLQMEWAMHYQLPIVIHTRNAMQETINAVKPFAAKGLRGIFHCFSGSAESAKQVIDMNFLLGIGGVVTYKNAGLPQALTNIDLQHIVLETDAPYLTPVPFRGKRNEPSYLTYVVQKLAEAKGVSIEEIKAATTQNAKAFFKPVGI
jgi:TatD DNase family protein